MFDIKPELLATGGNRHPAAADWDPEGSGLVAFGSNNNIALWKPLSDDRGVHAILSGHAGVVNVIKFWPTGSFEISVILSGSVDKTIRVWCNDAASPTGFSEQIVLSDHQGSINCIAVLPGSGVFVSGSADGTVKIRKIARGEEQTHVEVGSLQTISLVPRYFPLACALAKLEDSSIVMAVAGTRTTVQVFVSEHNKFSLVATLTGHEGWIRSLAFVREGVDSNSDFLLSSASQDKYIRLWRLHQGEDLPAISNAANDPALGAFGKSLSNKAHRFEAKGTKYSVTFEALLLGHEDWIYSSSWYNGGSKLQLLSASADNSLAVWESDPHSGVWICSARLGEISAQKGGTTATGSTGGFWIGLWSPDGSAVTSLGRTGGWRLWQRADNEGRWLQKIAVSGHVKEVKGVAWSQDGAYLLSTSSDQTTRLWAEWKRGQRRSWHEFSRPQIHGYDLNCIDSIGISQFISGADEKLLRVFDEPGAVATLLKRLCGITISSVQALPDAANIPVLGLSNKAIQAVGDDDDVGTQGEDERDAPDPASVIHKATLDLDHPPFEDHLARHMLWPESEKLYGHGYEISAVAASHDNTVVATACRASSIDHAVIRIYETKEWREIKPPVTAHSLTVTSLKFSDDDQYLLSVGRDRQWAIFERTESPFGAYRLLTSNPKGHSRMILDGSWAPSEAGKIFATAGRDKSVKIWHLQGADAACKATISASSPVTSVAFHTSIVDNRLMLAYGTEEGTIAVSSLGMDDLAVAETMIVDRRLVPSKTVSQLTWRPTKHATSVAFNGNTDDNGTLAETHQLAIASDDNSVRILSLVLTSDSVHTDT